MQVSETALTIAKQRAFAEIDSAQEIFDKLQASADMPVDSIPLAATPIVEARTRLLDELIGMQSSSQIIELAAGFSPRSTTMLAKGIAERYVEIDSLEIVSQKAHILGDLTGLRIIGGDVTKSDDLEETLVAIDPAQQITIANEGLLRYLDFRQKTTIAEWVYKTLKNSGGVWITPDITQLSVIEEEQLDLNQYRDIFRAMTGFELEEVAFKNIEDARGFFNNIGFDVQEYAFAEIADALVSPSKLGMTDDQLKKMLKNATVFVMKVAREKSND